MPCQALSLTWNPRLGAGIKKSKIGLWRKGNLKVITKLIKTTGFGDQSLWFPPQSQNASKSIYLGLTSSTPVGILTSYADKRRKLWKGNGCDFQGEERWGGADGISQHPQVYPYTHTYTPPTKNFQEP